MTDVSHHAAFASPAATRTGATHTTGTPWPLWPYMLVFAGGGAGLLAGRMMGGDAAAFETSLLFLLRFMAAIKFLGVLAAAAGTHWRFSHAIDRRLALAYLAALVPMALAPGLIWSLGGIALGALLFHVGLLAFLVLAWKDGSVGLLSRFWSRSERGLTAPDR